MKKLVGAGVLCVALDGDDQIVVLLGREREVPGWRHGSRKWCSFSGRAEAGESAIMSAAREFVEESCSAVALSEAASLPASISDVVRELSKARFVAHTLKAAPPASGWLCHITFLCRVPYDEAVVQRFDTLRAELLELDEVFRVFHHAKKAAEHLPRIFFPGQIFADSVVVDLRVERGLVELDYLGQRSAPLALQAASRAPCTLKFRPSEELAAEALVVASAWARVQAFVREHGHREVFQHPAVLLRHHLGRLTSACVNRGYLEKTEVSWFRLAELERLDRWSGEQFRRHFLEGLRQFTPQIRGLFDGDDEERR